MLKFGSTRKALSQPRGVVLMALSDNAISCAMTVAIPAELVILLVRRMYRVYESAMAWRSAFSFSQAARSIRRIICGITAAAKRARIVSTPIISIDVNARHGTSRRARLNFSQA